MVFTSAVPGGRRAAPFLSPIRGWLAVAALLTLPLTASAQGLTANPSSLSFTAPVGGSAMSTAVAVTRTGVGTFSFNVTSDRPWLSAAPSSGNPTLNTFLINVNVQPTAAGNMPAVLQGNLTVTVGAASANIGVTLTLTSPASLRSSPESLSFIVTQGEARTQSVSITRAGGGTTTTFSVSTTQPWLTAEPPSGSISAGPVTLTVRASAAGLPLSRNVGAVRVTSGDGLAVEIPVELLVTGTIFSASRDRLSFTFQRGGPVPAAQTVAINSLPPLAPIALSGNQPWLVVPSAPIGQPPPPNTAPASYAIGVNPTGLAAGNYSAILSIRNPGTPLANPREVPVTLTVTEPSLRVQPATVTLSAGPGGFAEATVSVSRPDGMAVSFIPTVEVMTPAGGTWLTVSPTAGASTRDFVRVRATTGALAAGTYQGTVRISPDPAEAGPAFAPVSVPVSFTVTAASSLSLVVTPTSLTVDATLNGAPQMRSLFVEGRGGDIPYEVQSDRPWLRVTPMRGRASPLNGGFLDVTVDPIGLPAGEQVGTVTVRSTTPEVAPVTVRVTLRIGVPTTSYVSRMVDGGGEWLTSIYLVNPSAAPAAYRLRFFDTTGTPLALAFNGGAASATLEGTLPASGALTLVSSRPSTSPLVEGWAEVTGMPRLGGLAVLRALNSGAGVPPQEVAVPFASTGQEQLLLPFDNTTGEFTTAVAITNTSEVASRVRVGVVDEDGVFLSQTTITLEPRQQRAVAFPEQFAGSRNRRGLAAFSSDGAVTILGLRFTSRGAFTALEPIPPNTAPAGAEQYVAQVAEGGGWRTTLLLVSPDFLRNSFQLLSFRGLGLPFPLPLGSAVPTATTSDAVPPGGLRRLVTPGTSSAVTQVGFLQFLGERPLGGIAIFRAIAERPGALDQEAGVPLSVGLRRFLLPYDNSPGLNTSVALANTHPSRNAVVRLTVRDEAGTAIEQRNLTLAPREHSTFELRNVLPSTRSQARGTVEFNSLDTDVTAIGLRFTSAGPFTALPVMPMQ